MLRSLWKLQWKQFAARMKKGNGKKTSGGWLVFLMLFFVVCMEILMFVVFESLFRCAKWGLHGCISPWRAQRRWRFPCWAAFL